MTIETAILWGQQSIWAVLTICGPPLLAALVVGLVHLHLPGRHADQRDDPGFRTEDHRRVLGHPADGLMDARAGCGLR